MLEKRREKKGERGEKGKGEYLAVVRRRKKVDIGRSELEVGPGPHEGYFPCAPNGLPLYQPDQIKLPGRTRGKE